MSELLIDCFNYVVEHELYGFNADTDEQEVWDYLYGLDKHRMSDLIEAMDK